MERKRLVSLVNVVLYLKTSDTLLPTMALAVPPWTARILHDRLTIFISLFSFTLSSGFTLLTDIKIQLPLLKRWYLPAYLAFFIVSSHCRLGEFPSRRLNPSLLARFSSYFHFSTALYFEKSVLNVMIRFIWHYWKMSDAKFFHFHFILYFTWTAETTLNNF